MELQVGARVFASKARGGLSLYVHVWFLVRIQFIHEAENEGIVKDLRGVLD